MSSTPRANLRVDWATYASARYACEHWHYSRSVPASKLVKVGAWEGGEFIGVVIFSWGSNKKLGSPFGLQMTEACELTRVALREHQTPVSRIVAIAVRFLRKQSPGLRLVVSYADPGEGHHGGIYQAAGWTYLGMTDPQSEVILNGVVKHRRSLNSRYGTSDPVKLRAMGFEAEKAAYRRKHIYALPLDDELRRFLEPLKRPYPKRARGVEAGTAADQAAGGGSIPTRALPGSN